MKQKVARHVYNQLLGDLRRKRELLARMKHSIAVLEQDVAFRQRALDNSEPSDDVNWA